MRVIPGEVELVRPFPPRLIVRSVCLTLAIHVNIVVSFPFFEGIPDDHPSLAWRGSWGVISGGLPLFGNSQHT